MKFMKFSLTEADVERFWNKVQRTDTCWTWTGALLRSGGYGAFGLWRGDRTHCLRAHVLSYELTYGPIEEGQCVLHHCDNPPCVRPDHLFLGDRTINSEDKIAKGRMRRGENRPNAKLTDAQVLEIRHRVHDLIVTMAKEYGVSLALVDGIVTRRRWQHLLPGRKPRHLTPG
jgi:hypothetical protein